MPTSGDAPRRMEMTGRMIEQPSSSDVQGQSMRAFGLDELGKPGSVRELAIPEAGAGEVLVRIRAASLNAFDCSVVAGRAKDYMEHHFPLVPGLDGAGTIEALGTDVAGFNAGDGVFGIAQKAFMGQGTLAEYDTFPADAIAHKPGSLTFE